MLQGLRRHDVWTDNVCAETVSEERKKERKNRKKERKKERIIYDRILRQKVVCTYLSGKNGHQFHRRPH